MSHVRSKVQRLSALCTVSALAFTASNVALAQTMPNAQVDGRATNFNIPAQPLGEALADYAEQADVLILASADVTRGKRSAGISGLMTASAALDALLDGQGLKGDRRADGSILVNEHGGTSDSKNLDRPTPVLMAQNQRSQAQTTSSRSEDSGTSIVTGKVTDARTGANLKGAKVTIEETGQWTSTNDLGEFRFVNVPIGNATIIVSFLGYAGQSTVVGVRDETTSRNFALRGGSEIEEIVVFGQRSARALALNQERTADNSVTVISSDLLGAFTGTTISETLRRAPGIALTPSLETGDGVNVIVRGLGPDFNTVTLNGLRLPVGNGNDRSPTLNNLLTESVSSVTINKTLLPSHDSSGTGGLIEIETKGPLDRSRRFVSFGVEGGRSADDFVEESILSATASGTFGKSDAVGLSASVQYRQRDVETIRYSIFQDQFGQYLPLGEGGLPITSVSQIDPRSPFPFESGVDQIYPTATDNNFNGSELRDFSITLSGQWQIADHTDLRLDITQARQDRDSFTRQQNFSAFSSIEVLPIAELGNQTRAALVWEDAGAAFGLPGALIFASQLYDLNSNQEDETTTYSLRGRSNLDAWEIDYTVGYSKGTSVIPDKLTLAVGTSFEDRISPLTAEHLLPEALNNTVNGRMISPFAPRSGSGYPVPLFTEAGFALYNSPDSYFLEGGSLVGDLSGENERSSVDIKVRYNSSLDILDYVEGGLFIESSDASSIRTTSDTRLFTSLPSLADLGLEFERPALSRVGIDPGFGVIPQSQIESFRSNIESIASDATSGLTLVPRTDLDDFRSLDAASTEDELSAYLQARLDFGKLEVVAGARVHRVDVSAANLTTPSIFDVNFVPDTDFSAAFAELIELKGSSTDVLPRLLASYRQSDNLVYRLGYYLTVARPSLSQLNAPRQVTLLQAPLFGPNGNQPLLNIFEGNPDLKPATTDNYDLSVEYYDDNIGVVKGSVFYKRTENLLFDNESQGFELLDGVVLPDDPRFNDQLPSNIFVSGSRPENSPFKADIWGVELSAERNLDFMPGIWDGLGIYANYTYTDSSKTEVLPFAGAPSGEVAVADAPYMTQPKNSGTVALTYNKFNVDASLAYSSQSRYLTIFRPHNLHFYQEAIDTLDFRVEYLTDLSVGSWRLYFEGTNLLKGSDDPSFEGSKGGQGPTPKLNRSASYFGGRVFRIGVVGSF